MRDRSTQAAWIVGASALAGMLGLFALDREGHPACLGACDELTIARGAALAAAGGPFLLLLAAGGLVAAGLVVAAPRVARGIVAALAVASLVLGVVGLPASALFLPGGLLLGVAWRKSTPAASA